MSCARALVLTLATSIGIGCSSDEDGPTDPQNDYDLAGTYYLFSVEGRRVPDSVLTLGPGGTWHRVYADTLVVDSAGRFRWSITWAPQNETSVSRTTITGALSVGIGPTIAAHAYANNHPLAPSTLAIAVAQLFPDSVLWQAAPPWRGSSFVPFTYRRAY